MRQASKRVPESAEKTVRDIRRATRRHHSAEEKIRNKRSAGHRMGVKDKKCQILNLDLSRSLS